MSITASDVAAGSRAKLRHAVPDEPIDYAVEDLSRRTGSKRYFGFFPYPARKPWSVVREYINHYTSPGDLVADPFCGSGVTAVEALVVRRRAIASDLGPVARFVTLMTATSPVDLSELDHAYEAVAAGARGEIEFIIQAPDDEVLGVLESLPFPTDPIPDSVRRGGLRQMSEMHTPRQLAALSILKRQIMAERDELCRNLLLLALLGTVRYANVTYSVSADRSPYRGNANLLRRFSYSPAPQGSFYEHRVWPTFERQYRSVRKAKIETNELIGDYFSEQTFQLFPCSAARLASFVREGSVDYVFTDPPYSNDIDFLGVMSLFSSWLGETPKQGEWSEQLVVGGDSQPTEDEWKREFTASMESIGRVLRQEHWFTLVYKHRDLSLWKFVRDACVNAGLQYVNSVWQDVKIRSTRQTESPDINPSGDMYINFRKLSPRRYSFVYPRSPIVEIPTKENYIEHVVERLVVAYLGADIELIAADVVRLVLDVDVGRSLADDPESVLEDLKRVLRNPRFCLWELEGRRVLWILAPETRPDQSLDDLDRVRYSIFAFLRENNQASEATVHKHLLSEFASDISVSITARMVKAMLSEVAREVSPHSWEFASERVKDFKQLRLFFDKSSLDSIREGLVRRAGPSLTIDYEGMSALFGVLEHATKNNSRSPGFIEPLRRHLQHVLDRLKRHMPDDVFMVRAVGDWATIGSNVAQLQYEEVVLQIILETERVELRDYERVSDIAFSELQDADMLIQFQLASRNAAEQGAADNWPDAGQRLLYRTGF